MPHGGEATSVDWHPGEKYALATGRGRDHCVKVWDIEAVSTFTNRTRLFQSYLIPDRNCQVILPSRAMNPTLRAASMSNSKMTGEIRHNWQPIPLDSYLQSKGMQADWNCQDRCITSWYFPLHTLFVSSPITSLSWRQNEGGSVHVESLGDSIVAVEEWDYWTLGLLTSCVPIRIAEDTKWEPISFTFANISAFPAMTDGCV